jgi:hypothetical protein
MRAEYLFAASLITAALAVPTGLVALFGDAVPSLSGGEAAGDFSEKDPLTLITNPILAPSETAGGSRYFRTVVAEIDLPNRASADKICKDQPKVADSILMHLGDPKQAGRQGPNGHDARLAWVLDKMMDPVEVENIAIVERKELHARDNKRPVYECRGQVAWRVGAPT